MMHPRRLTEKGIERFQEFIDSMTTEEPESYDPAIVNDPAHSVKVEGDGAIVPETCDFDSRFEAAVAIAEIIKKAELPDPALDRGFWCWLSWVWFESLCAPDKHGARRPRDSARWILSQEYNRYYRHLLAGPWTIFNTHRDDPERARCLLCTSVTSPGDLAEQIASRQELVSNPGLVGAATRLYYDKKTGKHKRGHVSNCKIGGKTRGQPGTVRRLIEVVDQLDLLWDLYGTSFDEFMALIPDEFNKFVGKTA